MKEVKNKLMADIAQCQFNVCPKSNQCYRFLAKPDKYQTYMLFQNICNEKNDYEWFWQNRNKQNENENEITEKDGDNP